MSKTSNQEVTSIKITKAFILLLLVGAVGMCIGGPTIVKIVMTKRSPFFEAELRFWTLLSCGYLCAVLFFIFLYQLFLLVSRIEKGDVFIPENVRALSFISNLVLAAAIVTLFVGVTCTYMILIITLAAIFITPIIRVVKNAFGKAVEMKEELDYTI